MLIKVETPDNIKYSSTLSEGKLDNLQFDFILTNPPYGKSWENVQRILGIEKKGAKSNYEDSRILKIVFFIFGDFLTLIAPI